MSKPTYFSQIIHVPNWQELNQTFEKRWSQLPSDDSSFRRGFIYAEEFTAVFLGWYTGGGGSWDSWIMEDEIYCYRGRGPIFRVDTVISEKNLIVEVLSPRNGFKASWDDLTEGEVVEITGNDFHHFERVAYRPPLPKWKTTEISIDTRDELLIELSEKGQCELGTFAVDERGRNAVCVKKVIDPQNKIPSEYRWFIEGQRIPIETQNFGRASITLVQIDEISDTFTFEVTKVSTLLNRPTKNLVLGQKLVFSFSGLIDLDRENIDDRLISESLRR